MRLLFNYLNNKLLSYYLFIKLNISSKLKLLKKQYNFENYYNKFDLLNHSK